MSQLQLAYKCESEAEGIGYHQIPARQGGRRERTQIINSGDP